MQSDDQAFLDQIEQNIRSKDNEQEEARREAQQRATEMERVRKASANIPIPGKKPAASTSGKQQNPVKESKPNELENDPRYKEYFERLRKQKGITTPAGGQESQPSKSEGGDSRKGASRSAAQSISPGAIVRFDDGSIGVYKDAVSGRDYALFYFLQPDGSFVPEGVFLQCYQAKVIGNLPEQYFSMLRDNSTWERDMVLYHLSSYDHVELLNGLAEHEERKPKPGSTAKSGTLTTSGSPTPAAGQSAVEEAPVEKTPERGSQAIPEPDTPTAPSQEQPVTPAATAPPEKPGLVKGRRFQIKFGGKQWEAVYWMDDPEGSIVAHSTHGHWSLMRLDLDRFKDSLELGDIVDSETMETIAKDAAAGK